MESDGDGLQTRAAPRETGVSETYVELGGITPTGTMWGGLRYYDRENYIWTTDYFYTDYSGTGVGFKNVEMADGKWDFAYINSNDTDHSDRQMVVPSSCIPSTPVLYMAPGISKSR